MPVQVSGEVRGVPWLKLRGYRCPSAPPTCDACRRSRLARDAHACAGRSVRAKTPGWPRSAPACTLHTPLAASDRARAVEGQVGAREEPDKLCSAPLLETTDCLQEGENRVRMMTGILTDYEMEEM